MASISEVLDTHGSVEDMIMLTVTIFLNIWVIGYFWGDLFLVLATLRHRESARAVRFARPCTSRSGPPAARIVGPKSTGGCSMG